MKIGVNATCMNDRPSGAKQRFIGIYGALFRQLSESEFVVFEPIDCKVSEWFMGNTNVKAQSTPVPSKGRIGKFSAGLQYWSSAFAHHSFDLFEAMHLPMVRPQSGAALLTIHDVRGLHSDNSLVQRVLFSTVLRQALQKADHVITVSATMKEEILAFYPHTPVSVIYNGFNSGDFCDLTQFDCDTFLAKHSLPYDFVLAVGHFERRKNYKRLIDALALLKNRGLDCPLVIIGNDSGEGMPLKRQIDSLGLTAQVRLLTGLSDHEVRCAYLTSSLFVFPSLYEGFGIPILEAMAAGKPMILSDLPVFREITQDRGFYFQPDNVLAIAEAIEIVLTSIDMRQQMIEYGYNRVKNFSFETLAMSLANLYRYVV